MAGSGSGGTRFNYDQNTGTYFDHNVPGVNFTGIDFEGNWQILENLSAYVNAGYDRARIISNIGTSGAYVAIVAIDRVKQGGKRRTQIEAQAASVADVENALHLLVEPGVVPIFRLDRRVGEAVGWLGFDTFGHIGDLLPG